MRRLSDYDSAHTVPEILADLGMPRQNKWTRCIDDRQSASFRLFKSGR